MKKRKKSPKIRKLIAIGDLHGDYCRFIRILRENNLLKKGSLKWNPRENNVDLVLIGDYEDWRGEKLEGRQDGWLSNTKKLLEYFVFLWNDIDCIKKRRKTFKTTLHLLMGNHDKMMLDSHKIVKKLNREIIDEVIENSHSLADVRQYIFSKKLNNDKIEDVMSFLNWFAQGGQETIQSFGSLDSWLKKMDGDIGNFYRSNLKLAVKINGRFFAHTMPDDKKYWMSVKEINKKNKTLQGEEKEEFIKAYVWGRKIFGFDINTGMSIKPFSENDIDEFLKITAAKSVVIGHTPMFTIRPVREFNGKVINLDVHGVPGAGALVEEWQG